MSQASHPEHEKTVRGILDAHIAVAQAVYEMTPSIVAAADTISRCLLAGGLLMIAGNGGSAADAQHISAEFTGRFMRERRPLRAMALHANTSGLTAIGNDYGFDKVFSREVQAHGRPGDVLLCISTSGNSVNVLTAIDAAREQQITVIGLTGGSGGQMKGLCDLCLCVPSNATPRIQEMHITIAHTICELVEAQVV